MSEVISYDEVEDILFIHKGFKSDEKFKGNIDLGNIIFDLSTKGRVVGIEIMNASKFFREVGLNPKQLKKIRKASIRSIVTHNSLIVFLGIKTERIETKIPIPVALSMPVKV